MSKALKENKLSSSRLGRALLAVSLTASLAAAGCTTNRTPGSGEPYRDGFVRTAPTGGVTGGSEMPVPPPMISSSSASSNRNAYVGPDAAAAIMAQRQPQVRVLGASNPSDVVDSSSTASSTAQRNANVMYEPQRVTVNSSINSAPVPAIVDVGDPTIITSDGVVIGTSGMISNSTITSTPATTVTAASPATPTATTLTPGAFAGNSTATPATTGTGIASVTTATSGTLTTTPVGTVGATIPSGMTPTTTTTNAGTRLTVRRTGTQAAGTVRAQRSSGGQITITNQ